MSAEEEIFWRHEQERQAWLEAQAKLSRQRLAQQLRQAEDRDANGAVVFGMPQAYWNIASGGPNRSPTQPQGFYIDDSKYQGHNYSIYEPNFATRLWHEAIARSQRSDNRNLPQQYSTSQLGEGFSQMDIREIAKRRVNGARW